ncbi:MAG: TetR/AcrR family transcriptional regulator [Gammaproteobacteria bacterium]
MSVERNRENTRQRILVAAFEEMHRHGYQGLRVDQVLNKTGLKKGALYHHFPSKQALGYAVLEELIEEHITRLWITPLKNYDDPLIGLQAMYERIGRVWTDEFFSLGCPLNNLAQEMSPIDDGFRERIERFFQFWRDAFADALAQGQRQGIVARDVDCKQSAMFMIAAMEGALGMTKNQRVKSVYVGCGKEMKRYLEALRVK